MGGGWDLKIGHVRRADRIHGKCVSVATGQCSLCDRAQSHTHIGRGGNRGEVEGKVGLVTWRTQVILIFATSVPSQDGDVPK